MSQRKEKYARQTAELKERVYALESRMFFVERQAGKAEEAYKKARHATTAARCDAARWKLNAILTLVLLVLVAACCIVYVSAQEPEEAPDGPVVQYLPDGSLPGDDVPATEKCYMEPEEVEAAENEMIEAALLSRATRMDDVTVTHYCTCVECCGKSDGITASGLMATPGVTVAVDPDVIPLGADVLVDYGDGEIHYYRADDVGGAIQGNRIDLCMESHEAALQAGIKTATVWWVIP